MKKISVRETSEVATLVSSSCCAPANCGTTMCGCCGGPVLAVLLMELHVVVKVVAVCWCSAAPLLVAMR